MITDVFLSILTVCFAMIVVFCKKTVISAFALLMAMLSIGMIYFQLGTVFLSAVQVLINAGAIAILFIFVMMLVNLEQFENAKKNGKFKLIVAAGVTLIALTIFVLIINSDIDSISMVTLTDNSMGALFDKLFSVYYLPFEMATVLLLASIIAVIVITGHEQNHGSENKEERLIAEKNP